MTYTRTPTIVVAGAGLTGLSAAISAREAGARVVLLENGSREDVGGNAAFSGGLFPFCYDGPDDLTSITEDFEPGMKADRIEAPPYTRPAYAAELSAMSGGQAEPRLVNALAARSLDRSAGWPRRASASRSTAPWGPRSAAVSCTSRPAKC
ncbi:FAD-binding protein [Streptomyces violaceusniger]|uniref:FAD-dependent oxidoreductase 2 FAD-binding domain-containing protein n=1 Tax=Streptomyces violaceusniger TaxID=68280 RepID=A0A4D4KWQ1_STRVO|nr:hypothetical protein SVIO_008660 [Streptomyces violaceusniger]